MVRFSKTCLILRPRYANVLIYHKFNALPIFKVTAISIKACYKAVATNSKIISVVQATTCVLSLIYVIANR
jgi:hypothetical protein